ncbi:peptide chain release factor N(5)-glutamine methyltransferase [Anaplasma phagocytophilum str. Norway variant1]|uniref:peptide chain release factor N(5)-glutamine methyltransferase n=1 Tax=Anaplasma phagocytophilum str. Norway variant1 TaxID=1392506 RepID=A0A7H9E0X1_ANAPH|nr:peptide chain release factor N(5)-glutamine methyltransferase [Anaplasma phagocytophilum]QLL67079.1 peptide chain release factor N(5)-glutamine methyltransferase [Anaplasma phagocytophilum str. Norway variant1]
MSANKLAVLLSEAASVLKRVGIDTPGLDARLIAGHVLGLSEHDVLINPDLVVTAAKTKEFFEVIARRLAGVPVSHILRRREFWSIDFAVGPDVLDPRQDTETIISEAIKLHNRNRRITIADLGTGTACIIIALLSHYKNAVGVAFEKSTKAYRIAHQNLQQHGMTGRVRLHRASWEKCNGKFDLIVSNPPYIKRCKISGLQPEVRLYEPMVALDGGVRGMEKYLQIFEILRRCLKPDGKAILEIGEDQHAIRTEALRYGMKFCHYVYDLAAKPRCVVFKRLH